MMTNDYAQDGTGGLWVVSPKQARAILSEDKIYSFMVWNGSAESHMVGEHCIAIIYSHINIE